MTFIEETVTTVDGLRLYARRHEVERARGELVIVHGFGEHSGRYGPLSDYLVKQRYSVTSYDHRGHGLSDGVPGHVESFSEYEYDLESVIAGVRARDESGVLFLIGHSMGGLILLRYLAKTTHQFAGAVLSAPLLGVAIQVPAHKMMIARVGARFAPRMRLGNEIDPAMLSRDPEVGRAYAADPLVNKMVSMRWFSEAKVAMEEAASWAPEVKVPILVMHGTADKLADCETTRKVFEALGSADKELEIYQGYYHELFNEPEKRDIFDRVSQWLDKHDTQSGFTEVN
jgi:alpha-beta hydrolase superfamily lysophospholipase